jgi:hypothetical protein
MRVQLRKLEQTAMKKGKYAKFTPEFEEVRVQCLSNAIRT